MTITTTIRNRPLLRWGPVGEFEWYFGGDILNSRGIRTFDATVASQRLTNIASGGQIETLNQYSYFDVSFEKRFIREDELRNLYSFASWANAGNPFLFSLDYTKETLIGVPTATLVPGDIRLFLTAPFPAGFMEAVIFNHLGQYDKIEVSSDGITSELILVNDSVLTNTYTQGLTIIRYAYLYPNAKASSPAIRTRLRPGKIIYNWSFKFTETMDVTLTP